MTEILFESERLYFREPCEEDTEILFDAVNEVWPELRHWMSWTSMENYTIDDAHQFTVDFTKDQRNKGGQWAFGFHKATHDLVVSTGLAVFEKEAGIYETGYWVTKNYLGQGYATEATLAVVQYAFEQYGANKITLRYYEGNDKSRRVIEKCGFKFIKTLPKHHKSFATGEMLDEHCYALSCNQWRARDVP